MSGNGSTYEEFRDGGTSNFQHASLADIVQPALFQNVVLYEFQSSAVPKDTINLAHKRWNYYD